MESNTWNTAILIVALALPWPILAGICWWFWKHRADD
jgi:heme/copper-type cytochrome/quinol oxidase subunit 4